MAQILTVRLNRGDATPWGFRLQGGVDFGTPIALAKVNGGSLADNSGLVAGDTVLKVNGVEVYNLRHKDAQDLVVRAGNNVELTVQRGGCNSTWRPNVTPVGNMPQAGSGYSGPVTKTSLVANQQPIYQPPGTGYNTASKPYANGNGYQQPQQQQPDQGVKSIVNKQYNTPVGIYSEESIAETLSAQAEVLAGGVLGVNFKKNEKAYDSTNSEVFKMLQEAKNEPPEPEEPRSFSPRPQQQYQTNTNVNFGPPAHHHHVNAPVSAPVSAPVNRANTGGLPTGQNICAECERLIVGVFVRIKDKNLHVDCFRCATCGSSLKNQGYFNINNKLYCDVHAKLIAMKNPPPGTEGYIPVPIKPSSKLSANTISQALSQHHNIHVSGNPTIMAGAAAPINGDTSAASPTPSHSRTHSWASSTATNTTHSCTTSPTPGTSASHSPAQLISPSHSRNNSLSGTPVPPDVSLHNARNNSTHSPPVWTPTNRVLDKKLLQLEKDCFLQEAPATENDKENQRLIIGNGVVNEKSKEETDSILLKTLDGRVVKSVQAPGKGKPMVPIKVNSSAPKPYAYPPAAAPKSPSMASPRSPAYPPPQPAAPAWGGQQNNNYSSATLPRAHAPSHAPAVTFSLPLTQCNNPDRKKELELKAINAPEVVYSTVLKTPPPPPPPPVTTVFIPDKDNDREEINSALSAMLLKAQLKETIGKLQRPKSIEKRPDSPPLPPPPTEDEVRQLSYPTATKVTTETIPVEGKSTSPIMEDAVVMRTRNNNKLKSQSANDRRSYIEKSPSTQTNGTTVNAKTETAVDQGEEKKTGCGKPRSIACDLIDGKHPICCVCDIKITRGPFITALGRIWCPDHFVCVNGECRRQLADIGFVEEKGDLYCEYCFEKYIAPPCSKCHGKIKGDCLNAIGKQFHPECFTCSYCGKLFGNSPFFLEDGQPYCEADWNEMFTTKCFACGFPVEAGDRWVEALSHNYHSQCFNCTACKTNLEGQSFFAKNGRPFCKNHAR